MGAVSRALPPAAERVRASAEELELAIHIRQHAQSTRTAEEAAAACGCDVGAIVKSLVFAGETTGAPVLLLVSGRNRVDDATAAAAVGEALSRPDAKAVRAWTGFAIGGIPPFGHAQRIVTFMDEDLFAFEAVWAAAGTPSTVFRIAPRELGRVAGATIIRVC